MAYLGNDKYNANLSAGYTVGDTTIYVDVPPTNVPTIIIAAKGTANETKFSVTGKTSNSLTGVARIGGANVNLDNGTPITCLISEEFVNQYSNAIFSAESLGSLVYGVDGGSTDDYVVSLNPAPTSYANIVGVPLSIYFNTANTGSATLNVNSLGAKTLKKNATANLETGDIIAGQIFMAIYDGTNFQVVGISNKTLTSPVINTSFSGTAKATASDVTTGTEDAKIVTPKALADAGVNTRLLSKVILITRDMTASSGDVSYTGVGFKPTSMIGLGIVDNGSNQPFSMSAVDSSKTGKSIERSSVPDIWPTNNFIYFSVTGGTQVATVKSYDNDGFTLTWVKGSSPTGSASVVIMCFK